MRVANDEDITPIVVRAGDSPITLRIGSSSLGRSVRDGMDTFAELDHVVFVLAILLVVVIERRGTWQVKPLARALRAAGAVIGAFTIAHLVALVAGALGWITFSPALVVSLLGAASVYVAAEDIARPDVRGRLTLISGFGLVFGIGFALEFRQIAEQRARRARVLRHWPRARPAHAGDDRVPDLLSAGVGRRRCEISQDRDPSRRRHVGCGRDAPAAPACIRHVGLLGPTSRSQCGPLHGSIR